MSFVGYLPADEARVVRAGGLRSGFADSLPFAAWIEISYGQSFDTLLPAPPIDGRMNAAIPRENFQGNAALRADLG
jgi:hypothetical protein